MKTYHRNFLFESNDFESLCKFVIKDNTSKKEFFIWHIGRMVDWKYNLYNMKKHFPDNFNHASHLWFNYFHELIGFVITEDFNHEFTVFLNEKYNYLYSEMLQWVKENWGKDYSKLVTTVTEKQVELIRILEGEGYRNSDWAEMTRVFRTEDFKDYQIEDPTISFKNMSEIGDYTEHNALRGNAWKHTLEDEMVNQIRAYTRRSPIYNAEYDFVLINKDGRYVSGCEAFIDYENNTAEIERVCTHSDFYNKGNAKIVLLSCLKRLAENQISTAYITGTYDKTIYLYGKLGHVAEVKRSFYELELM